MLLNQCLLAATPYTVNLLPDLGITDSFPDLMTVYTERQ